MAMSPDNDNQIRRQSNKGAEIIYLTRKKNGRKQQADLENCALFDKKISGNLTKEIYIKHPHKSPQLKIKYTDNILLDKAREVWENDALERIHPTATVLVVNKKILGKGGNGLTHHTIETCERKKLNMPTGQGYHLCSGNHLPENHSEPKAIRDAIKRGNEKLLQGASAYLYGHWWSCKDCSAALEKAGIAKLYISKNWTRDFLGIEDLI